MGVGSRLWAAVNGSVGPSPTFAPMALAQAELLVLIASLRHPALARAGGRDGSSRSRAPQPVAGA